MEEIVEPGLPDAAIALASEEGEVGAERGLWRNRSYVALLVSETIQGLGVEIAQVAIPIIAVSFLLASEFEVGALAAAEGIAFLLLSLPVGVFVDRVSRRGVMAWANVVRAVAMAVIPVLWILDVLSFTWLMLAALVMSAAAVFFDTAYLSIVPSLVPEDQLDIANSRLQTSAETARAAGPGIGGLLAKVVSAPLLPLAATLGYLTSAAALWRIPADEAPPPAHGTSIGKEMREGLGFVFRHPFIRPIVLATTASNLFGNVAFAMIPILLLRSLNVGTIAFGVIMAVGSVGGVIGAFLAPAISRAVGEGRAIWLTYATAAVAMFAAPIAFYLPMPWAAIVVGAGNLVGLAAVVAFNVVQVSMRQRQCPPRLLGRMSASIRTVIWGVTPIGAFSSGLIAHALGLEWSFWIGAIGVALGVIFLLASPLVGMRVVPVVPPGPYRRDREATLAEEKR